MNMQLIRKATRLFPKTPYTDPAAVKHARRGWMRSVVVLKHVTANGWIVDNHVQKVQ